MTEPKIPPPHLRGKSLEGCNWDLEMAAGGGDVSQGAADGQSGWPNAHRSSQAPPRSTFEEGLTKPTAHLFVNSADFPVQVRGAFRKKDMESSIARAAGRNGC